MTQILREINEKWNIAPILNVTNVIWNHILMYYAVPHPEIKLMMFFLVLVVDMAGNGFIAGQHKHISWYSTCCNECNKISKQVSTIHTFFRSAGARLAVNVIYVTHIKVMEHLHVKQNAWMIPKNRNFANLFGYWIEAC